MCRLAAWGGHLQTLQWAREHHCPWDARTCACAAAGGHLEVLRWARAHGGEWDTRTCEYRRFGWAPGGAEVGAGAPLPVG